MSDPIRFRLNGRDMSCREPNTLLLHYLRSIGLTGVKEGCAEGECGACAVVMVERDAEGARYEAINSCLVLMPQVHGLSLWTPEGMGTSQALHPVQEALAKAGGSQCGYCTPGFVSSLFAHYYRKPRGSVTETLSGNLCRCTGYRPIREAAETLPEPDGGDRFLSALRDEPHASGELYFALEQASGESRFDQPVELLKALQLRRAHPEARVIAGGTDVVVELSHMQHRPTHFLSLSRVEALKQCSEDADAFVIGAGATLARIADTFATRIPLLSSLWPLFASLPIRTRATLGGNLVTASPVGDSAPILLALGAEVVLASANAERTLPLAGFFTGYRKTALARDELLIAIRIPRRTPTLARFYKVTKRPLDDISAVAAAFVLQIHEGRVSEARIAFGGVAATPVRATNAEAELIGKPFDANTRALVKSTLAASFAPIDDQRASAAYRRALVTSLWDKFSSEVAP